MAIRIDVNGETMHGYVTINCKTKLPDFDQKIITKDLRVDLEGVSVKDVEGRLCAQIAVDIQNRHIRKDPIEIARGWTNKTVKWNDVYVGRKTVVKKMTIEEMLKSAEENTDVRDAILAMAETLKMDK